MMRDHFSRLDLNLLTIFDAIMSERNLTRAGARLGMTQSAVSHALARLRELTGDELFERTGRGVRPTPRAHEMAEDVHGALDMLRSTLRNRNGEFDIVTASRTFLLDMPAGIDAVLMPLLAARSAEARNLTFRISGGRAKNILKELRYGETWLALDYEIMTVPGYRADLLFEDPFVAIARKDHPALTNGMTLEHYQRLEQIALTWPGEDGSSPLAQQFDKLGVKRRVKFSVPNLSTLPGVVENGDLIATMSLRAARSFLQRFDIEIHELPGLLAPVPVYMVWHESFERDEGHIWLRSMLKDICRSL